MIYSRCSLILFIFCSLNIAASGTYNSSSSSSSSAGSSDSLVKSNTSAPLRLKKRQTIRQHLIILPSTVLSFDHQHTIWNKILSGAVKMNDNNTSSRLNYFQVNTHLLKTYTQKSLHVTKVQLHSWSKNQQLSYYINLYNALTVQRVLEFYPIKSIKELGSGFPLFKSAWKVKFFTLFGRPSNLDQIEHDLVRGDPLFNDPRVHFAFNCAAIGCPSLANHAFTADKLRSQLEKSMTNFLKDSTRNRYDSSQKVFFISKIFKWYRDDFENSDLESHSLEQLLFKYYSNTNNKVPRLSFVKSEVKIKFLKYNWNLNDTN